MAVHEPAAVAIGTLNLLVGLISRLEEKGLLARSDVQDIFAGAVRAVAGNPHEAGVVTLYNELVTGSGH